jgi:hypothetical protein
MPMPTGYRFNEIPSCATSSDSRVFQLRFLTLFKGERILRDYDSCFIVDGPVSVLLSHRQIKRDALEEPSLVLMLHDKSEKVFTTMTEKK